MSTFTNNKNEFDDLVWDPDLPNKTGIPDQGPPAQYLTVFRHSLTRDWEVIAPKIYEKLQELGLKFVTMAPFGMVTQYYKTEDGEELGRENLIMIDGRRGWISGEKAREVAVMLKRLILEDGHDVEVMIRECEFWGSLAERPGETGVAR